MKVSQIMLTENQNQLSFDFGKHFMPVYKKSNLMRYLPKPLASPFFVSLGCIIIRLKHLTVFMDGPLRFSRPAPTPPP